MCKIGEEIFDDIMERRLTCIPYAIENICGCLKFPFFYIVNPDIVKYLEL